MEDTASKCFRLYGRLFAKKRSLMLHIKFLTRCKRKGLVPNFIKLKPCVKSAASERAIRSAKKIWLSEEISSKHKQLALVEEQLYAHYWKLLKQIEFHTAVDCLVRKCAEEDKVCWQNRLCRVEQNVNKRIQQVKQTHRNKLLALERDQKPMQKRKSPQLIDNFVVNLSSTQLSQAELELLNKGLNFAIPPKSAPLADIINNFENAIQYKDAQSKLAARHDFKRCIMRTAQQQHKTNNSNFDTWSSIRKMKSRDVIFSRADKGNTVVIMDKSDYDTRVLDLINSGPYKELKYRNGKPKYPLNYMIEETNSTRQNIARLINDEKLERKLLVSNPKVASLYCLPKLHKTPLAMRPISSNINTPTEKMAAWLVEELKQYPVTHGKSTINSIELVKQLESVKVHRGEILVSFDVTALFPSVPVSDALKSLLEHLQRHRVPINKIEAYIAVAKTCMNQNIFSFRGKYYQQTFGLSMGSKLSPLLAELFMSDFENEIEKEKYFPRVWKRYVDDVFAVVKSRYLSNTLDLLNSRHPTIKFTVEKEEDGKLPFLDLFIMKTENNCLKFGIYRKPTSTDRYITSDSHHYGAQKQAAFHSMIHRLISVPLEDEEFVKEKDHILKAAQINGYDKEFVEKILRKHIRKKHRNDATTFRPEKPETHRISMPYHPCLTNTLKNALRRHGYQTVYKSRNTLRELLSNLKDKVPQEELSGIYKIYCDQCSAVYLGQTKRKLKIRLREHKNAVENERINESSVAAHTTAEKHTINWEKTKLIKPIRKASHLNSWESMYITLEEKPLMNEDEPPITSSLFHLVKLKL